MQTPTTFTTIAVLVLVGCELVKGAVALTPAISVANELTKHADHLERVIGEAEASWRNLGFTAEPGSGPRS